MCCSSLYWRCQLCFGFATSCLECNLLAAKQAADPFGFLVRAAVCTAAYTMLFCSSGLVVGLRAMKHKAVRIAGASCPCTDLHHFLARVNVAGGTSGACDLHGRLLLAMCTCLLSFGYPRLQCCLTAALSTVWATFANLCSIWLVVGWLCSQGS